MTEISLIASFLVVVAIVAKMLRAIRLLDGRVTLLQEQINYGRTSAGNSTARPAPPRTSSGRTPVLGVPVVPSASRTPAPLPTSNKPAESSPYPGEATAHEIDQTEADAVWARMEAEQERLKRAMGRDFQVRTRNKSASDIRGAPVRHKMTSQEIARKLERK